MGCAFGWRLSSAERELGVCVYVNSAQSFARFIFSEL